MCSEVIKITCAYNGCETILTEDVI